MKNFKRINIAGICINICSGGTPKSTYSKYYGGNIPWLNTKEVNFNRIYETEKRITLEGLENSSAKWIEKNSIIVAMYGATAGKCAISKIPLTTNQACCNLTIDPQKADYRFVFYALFNDYQRLSSLANGGAQQNLNTQRIKEFDIPYPAIEKQIEIADILSSLDDKIELNNRINDNLEQQAQAIFKSWFIDYEPFNGKIPSTWKEYRLADFFPVVTGKKNANVSSDSGQYPFFSCSQNIAWTDNYSFEGNAILVAGNGDFNVKWYNGKFEAYQRTYVLIPYNPRYSSWLYYAVKYNLAKITSAARGSVIRFITKGNLENFSFLAPRELDKYEIIDTFSTINHAIEQRVQENYRLQVFRDNLLPRLMTGEIDVSSVKI